jgi:hypothetical protein
VKPAFSLSDVVVAASIRSHVPLPSAQAPVRARLQLPQTPITVAAAKIASKAAAVVPRAFARLASLLAKNETPADAAPLRTLLPFLTRIDPANARALSEQIAAYVENVVEGGESKRVALLDAYRADDAPHVVAGRAAVETDVKTALLALADRASSAPPAQGVAVRQTLIAVTAAQIAALSSAAEDPNAIAFALPIFYRESGRAVHVRVGRDAPRGNEPMDAGNFHLRFDVDTAALGSLTIVLEAAERSVRVTVTTDRERRAQRMNALLPNLRDRLESLHYDVASMRADVSAPTEAATAATSEHTGLDLSA